MLFLSVCSVKRLALLGKAIGIAEQNLSFCSAITCDFLHNRYLTQLKTRCINRLQLHTHTCKKPTTDLFFHFPTTLSELKMQILCCSWSEKRALDTSVLVWSCSEELRRNYTIIINFDEKNMNLYIMRTF